MAATRAIPPNLQETDPPDAPVLERLQYRIAQSSKGPSAASVRDSLTGSGPARPPVVLFPTHADGLSGVQDAKEAMGHRTEPQTDWPQTVAELEKRLAEEQFAAAQAIATAQEQGRREGRQAMEGQVVVEQQRMQTQILRSLEEFRLERQNYFHHVEGEVVRLALAIAARILHREAQLDPLLLTGAVRVALDKLGDSTSVVMRVPPPEVVRWKEFFCSTGNSRIQPGILEIRLFPRESVC